VVTTNQGEGSRKRRGALSAIGIALALIGALVGSGTAQAAGPPSIVTAWSSQVFSSSARLSAQINPNGTSTAYHFDYITKAAYEANGGNFTGASRIPIASDTSIGSGSSPVTATQLLSNLAPDTAYRYRVVTNPPAAAPDTAHLFTTQAIGGASILADSRGWEMVSPVDKNGGEVAAPGALLGGGVLQAAAAGSSVTYSSETSFDPGAGGAPPASQYIATRGSGGWSSQGIDPPIFSDTYNAPDGGVPYQLFSTDLTRGVLLNGDHCRGDAGDCAVANPPLTGTDAPAGYQNYYLRDNGSGGYSALLGSLNAGSLDLAPADFDLRFAGASADLKHVVISSCAALTADATEVAGSPGCDPAEQNLYEWSAGNGLSLLNGGITGAALVAQSGAVSSGGDRVYWTDTATGDLYLHDAGGNHPVDSGATFQTASIDGATAFYTKAGSLYSYDAATYTPSAALASGVVGVLGASATGDSVYYQDAAGLKRWHGATTTVALNQASPPADAADSSDYPPATGTARVSADGTKLLFVSSAYQLSGYDNTDQGSPAPCGQPTGVCDSQVYLYDATGAGTLTCLSCNPTNERPIGASTIPGSIPNGSALGSTNSYKPRALSANGKRAFFDSGDAIAGTDTNNDADTYQWEAQGEGSCNRQGGCVSLISSGRAAGGASFVDASADGSDAFFLTDESLVSRYDGSGALVDADPGGVDLYDARVGGGFPVTPPPIICEGDACQSLPPPPVDPTLTTLLPGPGNPPLRYVNQAKRCKKGFVKRKGKCVKKKAAHHHKRGGRR
jgi:hypothetical protein